MVVHHDTQGLPNDAESYPKDHVPKKWLFDVVLQPICNHDHRDLQKNRLDESRLKAGSYFEMQAPSTRIITLCNNNTTMRQVLFHARSTLDSDALQLACIQYCSATWPAASYMYAQKLK